METYPLMTLSRFLYWKLIKESNLLGLFGTLNIQKKKQEISSKIILNGNIMEDII